MRLGSWPRLQMRPAGPPHSMRQAFAARLPIMLAVILLPAIAFASPPDASWIVGIYDGADGDDIVMLVYETAAAQLADKLDPAPFPFLADQPFEYIARIVLVDRFTRGPRAPPLRCARVVQVFGSLPTCPRTASCTEVSGRPQSDHQVQSVALELICLTHRRAPVHVAGPLVTVETTRLSLRNFPEVSNHAAGIVPSRDKQRTSGQATRTLTT
jgi:hypothetical protein